ncbi:hypothetical protein HDU83_001493 [Entophlyctis luteolus]|nr:hypothetical protein HDU82_002717 [Entophlyctis luteolus]KAJ3356286.1 hypothetical protein HDU83_001493 [Entophlyctis luteolus]
MTTEQQDQLMELIKLQRAQADLSSALADMHGAVVGFQQFPLCGPREESRPHQRLATTAAIAEGGETTTASGRMSSRTSSAVQTAQQHPSPPSSAVTATIPAHFGDPGVVSGDVNAFRAVARKIRRNSSYTNGSNGCVDLETSSSDGSELAAIISTYTSPLESWTVPMVAEWAKQLGASPKSVAAFIEQDIDGVALLTLTGDDLKNELKVDALGTRRRIAVAIERLR